MSQIKSVHLKAYVQNLIAQKRKPSYINGIIKTWRAWFRYCVEEEILESNPVLRIKWQKEGKTIIQTFSDDEVKRLLEAFPYGTYLDTRNNLIISLAFDTGARNTEICDIKNDDVNGILLIHGKGNKERNVPITPILRKKMFRYERLKDLYFSDKVVHCDNYLLSRSGRALTKEAVEQIFNKANEIAQCRPEIRCSPHTARHYYAQFNLRQGLDVYSLSRLLGHESINITKRYLQSLQDEQILDLAVKTSPLSNLKIK